MTQELISRFLKLIIEWIKKHLAQLQSIQKDLNDWSKLITNYFATSAHQIL